MKLLALSLMLIAAALPAASGRATTPGGNGTVLAQLSIRQRIVIRMPRLPAGRAPMAQLPPPVRIVEKKGPKCVPVRDLAGSAVGREDAVDLLLSDGSHLRAKLDDDCPALDFYAGFYLKQTPDGMLCADRDVIRARSGRACPIGSFKRLEPRK